MTSASHITVVAIVEGISDAFGFKVKAEIVSLLLLVVEQSASSAMVCLNREKRFETKARSLISL